MRSTIRKTLRFLQVTIFLLLVTVVGVAVGTYASMSKLLPDTSQMASYRPSQTTKIFSRDGQLLAELAVEDREVLPISKIPKAIQYATVAIEDERFYQHYGVDFRGILRAAYQNYRTGGFGQGGSTITEQLAKNIYLTREKTVARRLQQMMLALQIERQYSKEEILQFYLNQVCYGHGAYGVEAASKLYFGKRADQMTLAECAMLAGIPRRPAYYSPYEHPDEAIKRRNLVLTKMAQQGFITWDESERAKHEKLHLIGLRTRGAKQFRAPYFTTTAIKELVDKYGVDLVYKGGLRVYTTLDLDLQAKATEIVRDGLRNLRWHHASQAALVLLNAQTGEILAMVGGRSFAESEYNRATQAHRQPGSSFKPFVYAAAIDSGMSPDTMVTDAPVSFGEGTALYHPENYDHRYRGRVTLRQALAKSINVVAVKVIHKIGPQKVVAYAHRMGIQSPLDPVLSLALGTSGVTLLENTAAYGAFACGGVRAEPTTILRVCDYRGNVLDRHLPERTRVLSAQTASQVISMLQSVVQEGTGRGANIPNIPLAGKTGTTQNGRDAWFIGFTPELVCGVWVGNDNYSPMRDASGSGLCVPIWREVMSDAIKCTGDQGQFPQVESTEVKITSLQGEEDKGDTAAATDGTVEVPICTDSGQRATEYCPSVRIERFQAGMAPTETCTLHPGPPAKLPKRSNRTGKQSAVSSNLPGTTPTAPAPGGTHRATGMVTATICTQSGLLANEYCPSTAVRQFPAGEAPTAVCRIHKRPPTAQERGDGHTNEPASTEMSAPAPLSPTTPSARHSKSRHTLVVDTPTAPDTPPVASR